MLDDLKYIHERDAQDALGVAEKQWQQLEHSFKMPNFTGNFLNIVHSGMGGSALWALLSTGWPGYKIPFEVVRDYDVPQYVDSNTLFIASSYSGNTEETLSALAQAEARKASIIVITSGGKMGQIARDKQYPLIELPKIDKPRYGALYGLNGLVAVCEQLDVLAHNDANSELRATASHLKTAVQAWLPTVPTSKNLAKQIAQELMGRSVVTYAGPLLSSAAHKWKISFNENAKNIAWEYSFPEFNHNEFTGWTSHPTDKPYAVVFLRSSFDNDRIKKRFVLSNKLLSGLWPAPITVDAQGETRAQQLLWTVALGDFVSLYLAMLNGVNPIEKGNADIIERFKKELG